MAMDRERLLAFFRTHYLSRREVLNKLPLSMDAESFWKDLQSRRRSDAVTLPLYNPEERAYWYCLTDKLIAASERLSEEAISQTASLDPYRMQMTGAMTEEMYFTSFVEGAQIPIQDAMEFLQRGTEPENIQEQLIWNNCQAWSMLVSSLYRPLDEEFVKTLAFILTQEMDSQAEDYRTEDGHEIAAMQGEEYRVPHAYIIPPRMGEFYAFLRQGDIHPLIKASAGQAFVLATRPFPEGNERLARMISSAVLLRSGYDFFADISISGMIAREGYRYYKAMMEILSPGNGGDMTYFMEYYLDMLVRAVDDRRERERLRQQRREEQERMSLEQEREMAKQPLASPGTHGDAEPLEKEPGEEPEELPGDGPGPQWEAMEDIDWDSGEPPSDDLLAVISDSVRGAVRRMSIKESPDADLAAELIITMIRQGLREFTWDDIREIGPVPINAVTKVLKKLAKAGYIKNIGPNNPRARYRITFLAPHGADSPDERNTMQDRDETQVKDPEAVRAKYASMIAEAKAMSDAAESKSEKRISEFIVMKLTRGETDFTRTEIAKVLGIEQSTAEDDAVRTVEYGMSSTRRDNPNSLMTYMILPERLPAPVTTDFTDFLSKLMAQLYDRFSPKCFHSSEMRALVGEKTWKLMRLNIEKLVRRGMVERKKLSRFESEYRILTHPEERPDIFHPLEEEDVHPSFSYAGGSSYAGPAVSYAAAGV